MSFYEDFPIPFPKFIEVHRGSVKQGVIGQKFGSSSSLLQRRQWHPTPVLLPGKSHGAEEPGRLQSMGLLRVGHD